MSSTSKTLVIISSALCALLLAATAGLFFWAKGYEGRVAPNVYLGDIPLAGKDEQGIVKTLQEKTDALLRDGVAFTLEGQVGRIALASVARSDAAEDVQFDVREATRRALATRHSDDVLTDAFTLLGSLFSPTQIRMPVSLNRRGLEEELTRQTGHLERSAQDASFIFTQIEGKWEVQAKTEEVGFGIDRERLFETLREQFARLDLSPVVLVRETHTPSLTLAHAQASLILAQQTMKQAPLLLEFQPEKEATRTWKLTAEDLSLMLIPSQTTGNVELRQEAFEQWVQSVALGIERPAQDAKFEIRDGRAAVFTKSQNGLALDRARMRSDLLERIHTGTTQPIQLVITSSSPTVTLKDVNDLGIVELLGVGTSNFKGSPANRVKNIRNGVRLLNGLLIPPGETFSLLQALGPFDESNGYLPELVIKGNEIKPELGGGLCQIGTTTFRATMNSGLPVKERRNHSLVVSYYNDPSNRNPGTDATIYEPAPDYNFTNDTDGNILFQAEMDEKTGDLRFSFWGTPDGRRGSYSAPVVTEWIPSGNPVTIETSAIAVGAKSCQNAYVGANAHFTYSVVKPDGSVEERVFESHYRPLPAICLVGVEKPITQDKIYSDIPLSTE